MSGEVPESTPDKYGTPINLNGEGNSSTMHGGGGGGGRRRSGPVGLFGRVTQSADFVNTVMTKYAEAKDETTLPTPGTMHHPVSYPSMHWLMQRVGYGFANGLWMGGLYGLYNGYRLGKSAKVRGAEGKRVPFNIRRNQIISQMGKQGFRVAQAGCLISPAFPFVYRYLEYYMDYKYVPFSSSAAFGITTGLSAKVLARSAGGRTPVMVGVMAYAAHAYTQWRMVPAAHDPVLLQKHQRAIFESHYAVECDVAETKRLKEEKEQKKQKAQLKATTTTSVGV